MQARAVLTGPYRAAVSSWPATAPLTLSVTRPASRSPLAPGWVCRRNGSARERWRGRSKVRRTGAISRAPTRHGCFERRILYWAVHFSPSEAPEYRVTTVRATVRSIDLA